VRHGWRDALIDAALSVKNTDTTSLDVLCARSAAGHSAACRTRGRL
jgi:hypothetical protein